MSHEHITRQYGVHLHVRNDKIFEKFENATVCLPAFFLPLGETNSENSVKSNLLAQCCKYFSILPDSLPETEFL